VSWTLDAVCSGVVPTEAFYGSQPTAEAIAACASCPVPVECLADELGRRPPLDEIQGYRAGLTAEERRPLLDIHTEVGTRLDPRIERVRAAVLAGVRVADIAVAEGVTRRTVSRWLHERDPVPGRLAG
jgi:Transcription factor WhiB